MKPQISEGFGSDIVLLHKQKEVSQYLQQGGEGVAIILYPETDLPSFLAVKKLYEYLPDGDSIKVRLAVILSRIEREHQDIAEAGSWEK